MTDPTKADLERELAALRQKAERQAGRARRLSKKLADETASRQQAETALGEALAQHAATAGVLDVMSGAPADLDAVLDAIAEQAARVCEAAEGTVLLAEGDRLTIAALYPTSRVPATRSYPLDRGSVAGRAVVEQRTIQVEDLAGADEAEYPVGRAQAMETGMRTVLSTPLLQDGRAVGAITIVRRDEVKPFAPRQVEQLRIFAAQAVIALEHTRVFTELGARNSDLAEALAQQTATADILKSISASPTDYQPVFDTIVRNAGSVCGAVDAMLWTADGDELVVRAHHGPIPGTIGSRQPVRGSVAGRAVLEARVVHVENLAEADDFPVGRDIARRLGWRTTLSVPLLREGAAVGAILIRRSEVRLFTPREIALLQIFADQAVIAIENVRLFTELEARNAELGEALEQQTATAEILRVIFGSPTALPAVYDIILERIMRLCEADIAALFLYDGEFLSAAASRGITPGFAEHLRHSRPRPSRETTTRLAALERRPVHVADLLNDPQFAPRPLDLYQDENVRTVLSVPMLQEDRLIGVLTTWRREVRPFADKQVTLLQTFADQAVIAVENARLFRELADSNAELRESLEQQTATAEILRLIGTSPTDAQPVFEGIARSGVKVLDALGSAVFVVEGDTLRVAATHGVRRERVERFRTQFPAPFSTQPEFVRTVREGIYHLADIEHNPEATPEQVEFARLGGYRTRLMAPMMRGDSVLGIIAVTREAPAPFPERQVELLKTFADQAVIAIENVRLFTELQATNRDLTEALEQQTATAEILRVMSSSPTDVQPVLDVIAKSAVRLCGGYFSTVVLSDGETVHLRATHNLPPEWQREAEMAYPAPLAGDLRAALAVRERRVVHVLDMQEDPDVAEGSRRRARISGYRSWVGVPMLGSSGGVGAIAVSRRERKAFSDREIALLRVFADQAVIAIENVRLFTELAARNADLTESLDRQTATAEILRVISGSRTDVQPVFDAIVQSAVRLCGALNGGMWQIEQGLQRLVLLAGTTSPEWEAILRARAAGPPLPGSALRWVLNERVVLHVPDIERDERFPRAREVTRTMGARSLLSVPMLRNENVVGVITLNRMEPFTEAQIELLRTFADQAVIAIENARLLNELEAHGGAHALGGAAHGPRRGGARRQLLPRSRDGAHHHRGPGGGTVRPRRRVDLRV